MFLEYYPLCMQLIISLSDWTASLGRFLPFQNSEPNTDAPMGGAVVPIGMALDGHDDGGFAGRYSR
jgi:hypothetical protein